MSNAVQTPHMKLVTGFVNGENNEQVGVPLSSPSGSIVQPYTGMLGGKLFLDGPTALSLSDVTNIGTLYAGVYQMVKFAQAAVRGQIVFWDISENYDDYIVTTDESEVPTANLKAGIALRSMTAGRYGFIQVAGIASVKFRAVLTAAGAVGSRVVCAGAGAGVDNGLADVIDDGTAVDQSLATQIIARMIGVAQTAPVGGEIDLVNLLAAGFQIRQ